MMAVIGLQQRDVRRPRSLKTNTQVGRDGSAFASDCCYSHVSIDGIGAGYASGFGYVHQYLPSATTRPRVAVRGKTNLSTQVTTDTAVA